MWRLGRFKQRAAVAVGSNNATSVLASAASLATSGVPFVGASLSRATSSGDSLFTSRTNHTSSHLPAVTFNKLHADGRNAKVGVVKAIRDYGVLVDLGGGFSGLLPHHLLPEDFAGSNWSRGNIRLGDPLTVYITGKSKETGKVQLALQPLDKPLINVSHLICDGRTQYAGIVESVQPYGVFVGIGAARPGFIPMHLWDSALPLPERGDSMKVYVNLRDLQTGRFQVSTSPSEASRKHFGSFEVDGLTPHIGVVVGGTPNVTLVDIGGDSLARLPLSSGQTHDRGTELTVYVVGRRRRERTLVVSLEPRAKRISSIEEIPADGQTPLQGVVQRFLKNKGAIVEIGCEEPSFLSADDPLISTLAEGSAVTVYCVRKARNSGRLTVSTQRRETPLRSLAEAVADGQTPHAGCVVGNDAAGIFVDVGFETHGLLMRCETGGAFRSAASLEKGDKVTAYLWHKNPFTGRMYLKLSPRAEPASRIADLPVDGVTPIDGTVIHHRGPCTYIDVGCDGLAILNTQESGNVDKAIASYNEGEKVVVYAHRRNPISNKVTLSLVPDARPRIPYRDVQGNGVLGYDGTIVSTQYGLAFVDFHCEVTGVLLHEDVEINSLNVGDRVRIRPRRFDDQQGRWLVDLDGTRGSTDEDCTSRSGTHNRSDHCSSGSNSSSSSVGNIAGHGPVVASSPDASPWQPIAPPPLPNGWETAIDPNTGVRYYFHRVLAVSQWEFPTDFCTREKL